MFRAILTLVLIAAIAWPNSICLCQCLHAAHASTDAQADLPREPEESGDPHDHDDDDEGDCTCCQLRQVLADPVVPILYDVSDDLMMAWTDVSVRFGCYWLTDHRRLVDDIEFTFSLSSAQMPCALRI